MYLAFAVFPKTAELFQPPNGALNHPPPGKHYKCMKLAAFNRLHFRANKHPHGVGKVFPAVTPPHKAFNTFDRFGPHVRSISTLHLSLFQNFSRALKQPRFLTKRKKTEKKYGFSCLE
jgi:hypothetical protein